MNLATKNKQHMCATGQENSLTSVSGDQVDAIQIFYA